MFALFFCSAILLFVPIADGEPLFTYSVWWCEFYSSNGHDMVCIVQFYFNKMLILQYNSTWGKFVAYRPYSIKYANVLNKNQHFLKEEAKLLQECRSRIPLISNLLSKTVEPSVKLWSVEAASSTHPALLICNVYDFYPKPIRVTWLRNDKKVTSGVTATVELSNGNWLYQLQSYLEYTPILDEKIACMVEHGSLMEPKIYGWDPRNESARNKFAIGTAGLLLGLIFPVAGTIYYKTKSTERILVPTT
ncbi:H-2 class II histocompatibility antigen, E-S beta chain-like [Thalassophryne amazonica]|uniref:H-2 class II histocompatibility antigen, E-S beta chain-like n=1 Tax=Thalassophryne amazonica TaxID=390379 RepID=UPI0014712469|nr:H-2 class II histocompatibility antigen, E-S beta chain-like [Thalassophryne amazonica]